MPEKHDLLAAILAAKEQGIGAILAFYWRTIFAADIMAVRFCKNSNRRNDVRHYPAGFIRDLLDFARASVLRQPARAYLSGYHPCSSIGSLIKRFAAKKAGVEDGRNQ